MDDCSLRFSGTCLKFCLSFRLASQYDLRSSTSMGGGRGGVVRVRRYLEGRNGNPGSRFPRVPEMVNSLLSAAAFLNRQFTVPSLNSSITQSYLKWTYFLSSNVLTWHDRLPIKIRHPSSPYKPVLLWGTGPLTMFLRVYMSMLSRGSMGH